jgi:hypothetical protein
VLANAIVDVAATVISGGERSKAPPVLGCAFKVGCAGQELRDRIGERVNNVGGKLYAVFGGGLSKIAALERVQDALPAVGKVPGA